MAQGKCPLMPSVLDRTQPATPLPLEVQSDAPPISFSLALFTAFLPPLLVLAAFWMAIPSSEAFVRLLLTPPVDMVGKGLCFVSVIVILVSRSQVYEGTPCTVCAAVATWLLMVSLFMCFPTCPILSTALLTLIAPGIAMVKQTSCNKKHFQTMATALFIASFVVFVPFLPWIYFRVASNTKEDWKVTDWDTGYHNMVFEEKTLNWKAAFVAWMLPVPLATELALLGSLCLFSTKISQGAKGRRGAAPDAEHQQGVYKSAVTERAVAQMKLFVMLMVTVFSILWVWLSLDVPDEDQLKGEDKQDSDMRNDIMKLCIAFCILTAVWIIVNLGTDSVYKAAKTSKVVERILSVMLSDWARAGVLCLVLPLSPLYFLIRGCLKQQEIDLVRNLKRLVAFNEEAAQNPTGTWQLSVDAKRTATSAVELLEFKKLSHLLWKTPVILKAQWLCLGYISFSVGVKLTTVVLAYTNELLANMSVLPVAAAMCAIGTFLFLLPPTPGAPVYALTGIIVTAAAQNQNWTIPESIGLSLVVATGIKYGFAIIAQKCIGEPMAKSTTVRSLVQIHSLEIRACQKILSEKQLFTVAKVCILCGGPDWPVAVLCGMLRLPLSKVLIALSPIILQSVMPCTLSGCLLMLFADDPDKRALGDTAVAVAGVLQMLAVLLAGFHIQDTIEKHHEELSQRPTDTEELKLLEQQEYYDRQVEDRALAFEQETKIEEMGCGRKATLILGLVCGEIACLMLFAPVSQVFGTPCFRKFEITDRPSEQLQGNPLNLAYLPGWLVMGLGLCASIFLTMFYYWPCQGGSARASDSTEPETENPLLSSNSDSDSSESGGWMLGC